MEKVQFGTTGAEVSALCLGTDYYGSRTNPETAFRLLDRFYEAGGTFIDTANIYAFWFPGCEGGESETTIGRWLKERRNRQEMFIGTKVGGGPSADGPAGLSAAQIKASCEKSLQRLGVETIDLYFTHIEDRDTPHEETLKAFDQLVQAGKVRFTGVSNHPAWRIAEARTTSKANGWAAYCTVEQRYTYLRPTPGADFGLQSAANDELLDYCREHELALLAYSILLKGAYTRADRVLPEQYVGPDSDARLARLKHVAQELGATPNQVIIAWLRQNDPPIIPIIGGSSVEQITENIDALHYRLSVEQLAYLNHSGT